MRHAPGFAVLLGSLACQPSSASQAAAPAAAANTAPHAHTAGEHSGMHHDFSDTNKFSQAFDDPARDAWQRPAEVIEHLHIEPGSTVVDLGAGTGYFAGWLSRAVGPGGQVLALDVEPNMVKHLEQRAKEQGLGNVSARVVAADDPGLAAGSVARVLIVDTWHHIDDRSRYAAKLALGLAPGAEIWIVDFTEESDVGPPARYRVPAEQVVRELQAAGLHAEIVTGEQLPKQYIVRASRP
ncbi:MAG TPA: methyltransferase domain-containing protein [Polyangiaceae bacterium]|nr:methyltransferase domain-containing protein [Polyangiaceae bacterium]